jgi:predicted RNA-binding Zn ribbon-like protein
MSMRGWDWLGEHLAVDLVNTVRRRGQVMTELLEEPTDLAGWLQVESDRLVVPAPVDQALLGEFVRLRDHTLQMLRAAVRGEPLPADSVAAVNAIVVQDPVPRILTETAGESAMGTGRTGDPAKDLLARLAAAVVDLLSAPDLRRLAFCDAPSCGQYFQRRRPNQKWCCPACGDRARVARHQQRHAHRTPEQRPRTRDDEEGAR